ncbi:pentatricopeptide repeat-containing protein At5g18390, mitochondrial [Amborella trichopoda]|uniref:Pentacotripeptide-repeat region of PRORP domain-containing protein n=1 Tax=Amborella trichopoda TaxID=13333 RepID=W1NQK6_AMBTC|nr:pentatricopeptide repeat-containing protein At5g18390, mitochondrial [Amborella trichopoda]XP_020517953.1 pentatricopeptide repeat-containing protein At5g18390, mitochondrial [Amborella trichopoda]XP_020517954.1 pentatricopeptide repeat-containing protein At5g18390, mitochondrial [Amborella trichopoda]XP_020517955.1 pentatricopeptide repeat-containing protein At5g18390, mitochondrial [Amborella trichopoda]XP_020517956.1 pentatricopeptide repeat-containing protein At5g18390, mitochondrial [Am|eukprot:XP_006830661.3 pentatricopeptide repeat-containing protein At5g18390, mitochondrial [Amborella trichopoda]
MVWATLLLRLHLNHNRAPFLLFLRAMRTTPLPSKPDHEVTIHGSKDDYFAVVHHISNIVRRDYFLERTLQKLNLTLTPELVYRVLRSCNKNGIESFRFFNWARTHASYHPTTIEFEELIKTLGQTKNWETMWKVADHMKILGFPLSPETFSAVMDSYGKAGLLDRAVEVFNRMKHFDCPQTTGVYNSLLSALCMVKNFQGAYALIRRMIRKGGHPDKQTYAILVNGWCSSGKLGEAREFLEEMSKKGFNPPVRGRDLLIDGLLNAGYLESAKELVKKMTKEGFLPDISTFNSLLEALCNSGETEFCIELLRVVTELSLVLDIGTYKILIPAVSKSGQIDEAFRLLHASIEDGHKPFPSLYAPLLKVLCKRGQFGDAFSLFADMKAEGHAPNRPVYTMLMRMCCRGGRCVDAANYLVEMVERGLAPRSESFDMVIDGLKNAGKHDLAKRIDHMEISLRGR